MANLGVLAAKIRDESEGDNAEEAVTLSLTAPPLAFNLSAGESSEVDFSPELLRRAFRKPSMALRFRFGGVLLRF